MMSCGWEGMASHWPRVTDISGSPPLANFTFYLVYIMANKDYKMW